MLGTSTEGQLVLMAKHLVKQVDDEVDLFQNVNYMYIGA